MRYAPSLIKKRDHNANTPLQSAAFSNQLEMVKFLAPHSPLSNKNRHGQNVLHMIVASDRILSPQAVEMVELLLMQKLDIVYVNDANGDTPIHLAVRRVDERVLHTLLSRVPDFSKVNSETGDSILHAAAHHGNIAAVKLLLDFGHANKLNKRNKDKQDPLHMAASAGHAEVVRLLLQWGADPKARDKKKKTPIELAKQFNHTEAVDILAAFERGH